MHSDSPLEGMALFEVVSQLMGKNWLGKKIGWKGYLKYKSAKKGALVPVHIMGHDIVIRKGTPDLTVALSCLDGEFEGLRYLFPRDYAGVIVDAGGYIGTSALAMRKIFPRAEIVVVEPSEENIKILRRNLSGVDNVRIVYGALVGRSIGSVPLKNRGTGEWGFTVVNRPRDNNQAKTLQDTPAYTISQIVDDVERIGILKLDIEGGEHDILQNDLDALRHVKAIFIELHDRIVDGCSDLFFDFSKDRIVVNFGGEKFLSVKT